MIYSTYTWDLVQAFESAFLASCKTPDPLTLSAQTIIQEETENPEKISDSQQILSHCLGIHTQNSEESEINLETSPKKFRDKINRL